MRFLTECEWEGGASEGAMSLLEQLEALEMSEACDAGNAIEAAPASETIDCAEEASDVAIELVLDLDDASDGEERTDENNQDEWQGDDLGGPRARLIQRPHLGSGGSR